MSDESAQKQQPNEKQQHVANLVALGAKAKAVNMSTTYGRTPATFRWAYKVAVERMKKESAEKILADAENSYGGDGTTKQLIIYVATRLAVLGEASLQSTNSLFASLENFVVCILYVFFL